MIHFKLTERAAVRLKDITRGDPDDDKCPCDGCCTRREIHAEVSAAIEKQDDLHRHFKGGLFRVLHGSALYEGSRESGYGPEVVVYEDVKGQVFVRPRVEWEENVLWHDGVIRPRFVSLVPEVKP